VCVCVKERERERERERIYYAVVVAIGNEQSVV
jgi:hypothetical protein